MMRSGSEFSCATQLNTCAHVGRGEGAEGPLRVSATVAPDSALGVCRGPKAVGLTLCAIANASSSHCGREVWFCLRRCSYDADVLGVSHEVLGWLEGLARPAWDTARGYVKHGFASAGFGIQEQDTVVAFEEACRMELWPGRLPCARPSAAAACLGLRPGPRRLRGRFWRVHFCPWDRGRASNVWRPTALPLGSAARARRKGARDDLFFALFRSVLSRSFARVLPGCLLASIRRGEVGAIACFSSPAGGACDASASGKLAVVTHEDADAK